MRTQLVAGNWKMHKTLEETEALLAELSAKLPDTRAEVVVAPAFVNLAAAQRSLQSSTIQVAAQTMHFAKSGAYTGEVSAAMLLAIGVDTVILGHSERRLHFGETDALLAQKVQTAVAKGMRVIFCVGEGLEERRAGNPFAVVATQLRNALFDLAPQAWQHIVLAYEPVWAIGTGETASPEQAQKMHAFIRNTIAEQYTASLAHTIPIVYGGSVKPANAAAIFAQPDVDGGLVGGASLRADDFMAIVKAL